MALYTERHGMRKSIKKTYDISIEAYALLFKCCEKYYNNLAWKYPENCPDGQGCCGIDFQSFNLDLKYEIPSIFRDKYDIIAIPTIHNDIFDSYSKKVEYDQYALIDLIEFFAENIHDVVVGGFHSYFGHHHLTLKDSQNINVQFQQEINDIFRKTGLLYLMNDNLQIERIVENSPLTSEIEKNVATIKENGTKQLLQEAIMLHKSPFPNASRDAVEKIWDALERLKTYYTTMDKKSSVGKIVNDSAGGKTEFITLFNNEFKALTDIGNNYRIRHHETNKIDITDSRHYDYFFNRCLSLIALAIQYLE